MQGNDQDDERRKVMEHAGALDAAAGNLETIAGVTGNVALVESAAGIRAKCAQSRAAVGAAAK